MYYIGIYFKRRAGGVICFYSPNDEPFFWYFKAGASIQFITKKLDEYVNFDNETIIIHINKIQLKDFRQLITYHEFMGMLASLSVCENVVYKVVPINKCQSRITTLLDIRKKKDFKSKLVTKTMHKNQYNSVWKKTNMMSQQNITNYRNAYMLAYYGYLKDTVRKYNHSTFTIG